jgi:hypothetical protein
MDPQRALIIHIKGFAKKYDFSSLSQMIPVSRLESTEVMIMVTNWIRANYSA